jgi:hypothetical protein
VWRPSEIANVQTLGRKKISQRTSFSYCHDANVFGIQLILHPILLFYKGSPPFVSCKDFFHTQNNEMVCFCCTWALCGISAWLLPDFIP